MTTATTYPIPTLPVARAHALALMFQPMVSLAELAAIVETDPAVAASILRAANSATSSPRDRIGRIDEAMVRIGMDDTRSLVVALCSTTRRATPSRAVDSTSPRCGAI